MSDSGANLWPIIIVAGVLTSFIVVGLINKSREGSDYLFAGRYIGRIGGGAAIASNWMSAASFLGMAGLIYLKGYFALAYVIGWTGGYVLLLVLMAGQIRRFGKYTAPDFVGERYGSSTARIISAVVSIGISLIYIIAQFKGIGMIFGWLFGLDYSRGLLLGAGAIISYVVVAGMLGVARNQQMQYFVLIVSFIAPLMYLAHSLGYFWLLPQFGYGVAIQDLAREFQVNLSAPFANGTLFQWVALCFTLMVGTAGLPHVLSRFYIVPNVRDARWSVAWGLFFIALIYWSAPAYAVFARLMEASAGMPEPSASARQMADIIVIRSAVMGQVPVWMVGILAAGATCAAFFTSAGLLITGASSFSHDIYYRVLNPHASEGSKMAVAKGATLVLAAIATLCAMKPPGMIAEITATAFALAGNTIFPAFLLGIWWGRANGYGVVSGMLTGMVITFAEPLFGRAFPLASTIFPLTSSALCGAPIVILVIIIVSMLTPPPPEAMRQFLAREVHGRLEKS
jgi:cation/acetate symporter